MLPPNGKYGKKVVVVMPAYNAARTLGRTYAEIPKDWVDEVILVDDASRDNTVEVARTLALRSLGEGGLPIKVLRHEHNRGYGGNQKTCYTEALKDGADIVVMLHPDYQYDPRAVPKFVEPIAAGRTDVVFGSRILGGQALMGGMPRYKYYSNKVLSGLKNLALGTAYTDLHTGYRAYSRRVLEAVPFMRNADDVFFDGQMIFELHNKGFHILEVPIPTMYHKEASSMGWKACVKYGVKALGLIVRYVLHRCGAIRSSLLE